MAKPKKFIDGQYAGVKVAFKITERLDKELELLAALLETTKSDILRDLTVNYVETTMRHIKAGDITNSTIAGMVKKIGRS
jgi:hypothetical protein